MKYLLSILLILGFAIQLSQAQVIDTLPLNKEGFMKGLAQKFDETNRTDLKDLFKEFDTQVKQGKFGDAAIQKLAVSCNKMLIMKGKPYPQLQQILKNYLDINTLNLSESEWNDFQKTFLLVMENSKKGDTKSSIDFLEFAVPLFRENALVFSAAKIWKLETDQFKLSFEDGSPVVSMTKGEIKGKTSGDSLLIMNTSGKYIYNSMTWKGTQGKVNWVRAGLPADEVYANFNAYTIDMNTQSYEVDSATFTYKNYFTSSISGKLEDKIVTSANTETTRYPRFSAERSQVPPQIITENVVYLGGFTLAGSKVLGSSDEENSELIIYKPNTKQVLLRAFTKSITINLPEKISSSNAAISIYFDKDSIYHPSINLFYDLINNSIKLVKGDGSLSKSSFSNSYHNIDFDVDVLTWNLNNDIINLSTISSSGLKSSKFESKEYFSEQKMKDLRGNVSYDPLSILRKYTETNLQNYIYANDYAKLISPNLTVQQIKPLLFNLVQEGFINYYEESDYIEVKPKVNHYVLSNAKKIDYDNISIISNDDKKNASLNLTSKNLVLDGVKSVPISLVNSTLFFPDSQTITIEKNRNMLFNGLFFSGRLDIFGENHHFIYQDFKMELPQIDTLIINIPDGNKLDAYGNPKLRPINSTLQELNGILLINAPLNKSGNYDVKLFPELAKFPIFESKSKSKVYYDSKATRGGTYTRDKFYYEIEPFTLDSLMLIDKHNLQFNGQLYSAGIFPNLKEPLRLQDDLSLGFSVTSPENGFDVYQGKGKFISDISLNNNGLTGSGTIKFLTASFESKSMLFFPDSMLATTDTFGIEESKGSYESPWVKSSMNKIQWYPYQDSMVVYSNKEAPFNMFSDRIKLDGKLEITKKGIYGSGIADWEDAQMTSNKFKFNSEELLADTASLLIKTIDGDKVTFNTPNVNAYVDFRENTGFFKSNTDENRTEFNYNQYATTIDEFFWDIDNKKLEFSVPEGSKGAPFVSLNLSQDTLSFIATNADYSLDKSIIEAHGVSEIFVADSRVIPYEGRVNIYPEAKMETLNKAVIEASAESKKHIMEDVTITIHGKYKIDATGKYKYEAKNTPLQYINLPKIEVVLADSSVLDKKKPQSIKKIIHAKGFIGKEENFIVYPNVQYYGDVDIYSTLDNIKIKGYTRVDFKNPNIVSDFFQVDGKVDPDSLDLTVEGAKDPQGKLIRTGIFVNKTGVEPIYTNILNNQIGPLDVALIEANGILKHDAKTGIYTFGDENKMSSEKVVKGNILKLSPQDNGIEAIGSLDFALAYGALDEKIAGKVVSNLEEKSYDFNTSIALPIGFDKLILDKMGYYLYEDNFENADVNYDDRNIQYQWAELISDKSLEKMQSEIATTGTFLRPKDLTASLVFTDVTMKYYPAERVYRSVGKFGLAFVGEKGVHKMINGYIEFGHRMGSDYMNLYLKTAYNDYIYITYTTTLMEVTSSFEDVITTVNAVDPAKRKVKDAAGAFYIYTGIPEMKAKSFIQRMKILEEGGTLPPPEAPKLKPSEGEEGVAPGINLNGTAPSETPSDAPTDAGNEETPAPENDPVIPVEEAPQAPAIPKEVLDFENNQKGKKNKGE